MKTNNLLGKVAAFTAIVLSGFVISCGRDDEKLSGADATNAISESITDGYFEDADDMSLVAANKAPSVARVATDDDERLLCSGVSNITFADGSNTTSGSFVINFGTGCTDSKGNVRSGKVNVTYSGGPIGSEGFKVVMTFTDYHINGVKLEGTRTVTRLSSSVFKHSIKLEDGKATWPDETFATRDADFVRTVNSGIVAIAEGGTASGTGRNGKSYSMVIKEDIIYKVECATANKIYMAVEGVKIFTNDANKTLTIDYGDGACDRNVTLTVGQLTFNYTVNK